jgi:hypothetical protein
MKRLKELEQENGLLKLLYKDLIGKFSAMKDGLTRSGGPTSREVENLHRLQ